MQCSLWISVLGLCVDGHKIGSYYSQNIFIIYNCKHVTGHHHRQELIT